MSDGRPWNEGGHVGPTHQREVRRREIEAAKAAQAAAAATEQAFEASDSDAELPDGAEPASAAKEVQA
jgi:hypothetical protein